VSASPTNSVAIQSSPNNEKHLAVRLTLAKTF
jgi:hypothetical protein